MLKSERNISETCAKHEQNRAREERKWVRAQRTMSDKIGPGRRSGTPSRPPAARFHTIRRGDCSGFAPKNNRTSAPKSQQKEAKNSARILLFEIPRRKSAERVRKRGGNSGCKRTWNQKFAAYLRPSFTAQPCNHKQSSQNPPLNHKQIE
jgi:hypothetical protein